MEILIVAILLGLIPGYIAQKKGRNFILWWIYGALIFVVALPHALIISPLPDSETASGRGPEKPSFPPVSASPIDFEADGTIDGVPFRIEPNGAYVAVVSGKTIKFRNRANLEAMIRAQQK